MHYQFQKRGELPSDIPDESGECPECRALVTAREDWDSEAGCCAECAGNVADIGPQRMPASVFRVEAQHRAFSKTFFGKDGHHGDG